MPNQFQNQAEQVYSSTRVDGLQIIKFAVNCQGKDKDWDFELLATKFEDKEGTIHDVAEHVLNGHALCAGTLNNRRRCNANITGSNWVLVDIDNSDVKRDESGNSVKGEKVYKHEMTLEEALNHPFVEGHCALIYTTASHTPEWHRFRLVFLFPEYVEGVDVVESAINLLLEQFPHDPACEDASRVFYGSSKAEIRLINPNATLPSDWIERARAIAERSRLETEQRLKELAESNKKFKSVASREGWDIEALIEQALSYIPSRCPGSNNYEECTKVLMALVNHYGKEQAEIIGELWSPSIKGDSWNIKAKIKSYKRGGINIGTLFYIAKQHGFRFPKLQSNFKGRNMSENQAKKVSVTGDTRSNGDTYNVDRLSVSATVTSVTQVLKKGLRDYEEMHELDKIAEVSELNTEAFKVMVNSLKCELDEVTPEDIIKLGNLINWHNSELDFKKALPPMATEIEHDAKVLNIDPIVIWQCLMPAILSLIGTKLKVDLESHTVPSNINTITVLESGGGKSRADNLVYAHLRALQGESRKNYESEMQDYERAKRECKEGDELPQKPVERKYLFDAATIQAVLKRISEQQGKQGQVWNRDEIAGLFKSLGQFNKNENEGLEILLKLYDGSSYQNDRVKQEDSYFIGETALSINGGIQPEVYRTIFKDKNDSQGLLARFLVAVPKILPMKRTKGKPVLNNTLPQMYAWLDSLSLPSDTVKLSTSADNYYTQLVNEIGRQTEQQSHPAIRAWMRKLPTQLVRIALTLHLIECYYDGNKALLEIQKDTLERAVLFAQYYRSAYHVVTELTTSSDDMSSILLKIWDKALTRYPDGITPRDAYRDIKALQCRAKEAGRDVAGYTVELFHELEKAGKGVVKESGRTTKFVACPSSNKPTSTEENQNIQDTVTVVTVAETQTVQGIEVSPENQVSLVTVNNEPPKNSAPNIESSEPNQTNVATGSKPSEARISNKKPRTASHPDNAAREASKTDSDKIPNLDKPKFINVGSPVRYKNSEDTKVYQVVGGDGKKWQLERLDKPAKSQKDIINDVPNNQLELVADGS